MQYIISHGRHLSPGYREKNNLKLKINKMLDTQRNQNLHLANPTQKKNEQKNKIYHQNMTTFAPYTR